jgi:Cytochrome c554 and c-prime
MRATRQRIANTVVLFVSSLLLIAAASCSFHQNRVGKNAGSRRTKEIFVANAFCSDCHYGFADENLVRIHKRAGIGCERCHGESERHRSDENNVTPPDIMYPRNKINPTCMMCHPRHEIQHVAAHKALLAGAKTAFDSTSKSDSRDMVCTDCHAKKHHMQVRTVHWNKATGELEK